MTIKQIAETLAIPLPVLMTGALDLILEDFEAKPGMTTSSAIGCRIIAACIDRLQG